MGVVRPRQEIHTPHVGVRVPTARREDRPGVVVLAPRPPVPPPPVGRAGRRRVVVPGGPLVPVVGRGRQRVVTGLRLGPSGPEVHAEEVGF